MTGFGTCFQIGFVYLRHSPSCLDSLSDVHKLRINIPAINPERLTPRGTGQHRRETGFVVPALPEVS
jgi:hypothetical protein